MNRLGKRLRRRRRELGFSLRDMEALTGLSNAYLSQLETGARPTPHLKQFSKIADGYGLPKSELLNLAQQDLDKVDRCNRDS